MESSTTPLIYVQTALPEYTPRLAAEGFAPGDIEKKGLATFDEALKGIEAVARQAGDKLKDAGPSKVTLEFDLSVGGDAGWFMIGKVEASAAFKVTLEWALKPDPKA